MAKRDVRIFAAFFPSKNLNFVQIAVIWAKLRYLNSKEAIYHHRCFYALNTDQIHHCLFLDPCLAFSGDRSIVGMQGSGRNKS